MSEFPPMKSQKSVMTSTYTQNERNKKDPHLHEDHFSGRDLVGKTGFEPATSCSQSRRSTRLSYFPVCDFHPKEEKWWLETGLNRRHADFQSAALPTELSSHELPTTLAAGHVQRLYIVFCKMARQIYCKAHFFLFSTGDS